MNSANDHSSEIDDSLELRKIVELILAKSWILLVSIILCAAVGIAYLKLAEPIYEAKATVEILLDSRNPAGLETLGMNMASAEALATVEANLQRTSLFQKVMARQEIVVRTDLDLPAGLNSIEQALEMEEWTKVQLRRGARLIDVNVRHASPEVAKLLATAIIEEYVQERSSIETGSSKSAFEMLLLEKRDIENRLESLEANQQAIDKVLVAKAAIMLLEDEVEVMLKTQGPLHPDVKAANSQVGGMYDELGLLVEKAEQALAKSGGDTGADSSPAGGVAGGREEALMAKADQLELAQLSLVRDIESERAVAAVIVARLKEAEITKDIQSTPLALVEPAFAPLEPVSPRAAVVLGVAAVLGGAIGLAVIGLLSFFSSTINTIEEAEQFMGLPVLGAIPYDKRLPQHGWLAKSKKRNLAALKQRFVADGDERAAGAGAGRTISHGKIEPLVLLSDPGGQVAESFRTLRATLNLRARDQQQKTSLVISATPNEGKSFVAANLAVAFAAQAQQRTLLIDADLRCPSLHVMFDLGPVERGLAGALLEGNGEAAGLVVESGIANLHVIPAGQEAPNPAELLSSPAMASILSKLASAYDRIVIDSAPLNAVADGLLLAPQADTVLLVARAEQTPRDSVAHAGHLLADAGCPPEGLVLTHLRLRSAHPSSPYSKYSSQASKTYGHNYRQTGA